jgi:DNA/RNA endonuclease YhcR with UshA esterase domain
MMAIEIMKHVQRTAIVALLASTAISFAASSLKPNEAARHVGEQATVCGMVASATYARGSRGSPTFLNLGKPFPDHIFTAVIWGSDRARFPYPPESLEGEEICVSGRISEYRGKPQIKVTSPSQISRAAE